MFSRVLVPITRCPWVGAAHPNGAVTGPRYVCRRPAPCMFLMLRPPYHNVNGLNKTASKTAMAVEYPSKNANGVSRLTDCGDAGTSHLGSRRTEFVQAAASRRIGFEVPTDPWQFHELGHLSAFQASEQCPLPADRSVRRAPGSCRPSPCALRHPAGHRHRRDPDGVPGLRRDRRTAPDRPPRWTRPCCPCSGQTARIFGR